MAIIIRVPLSVARDMLRSAVDKIGQRTNENDEVELTVTVKQVHADGPTTSLDISEILTEICRRIGIGSTQVEMARAFTTSQPMMSKMLKRQIISKGFYWKVCQAAKGIAPNELLIALQYFVLKPGRIEQPASEKEMVKK